MATQGIGTAQGTRKGIALRVMVVIAITLAIAVLVAQATSIWSTGTGSHGVSQVKLSSGDYTRLDRAPGCVTKYGCPVGETP